MHSCVREIVRALLAQEAELMSLLRVMVRKIYREVPWKWVPRVVSLNLLKVLNLSTESSLGQERPIINLPPSSVVRASWSEGSLTNHAEGAPPRVLAFREITDCVLSANSRGGFLVKGHNLFTPDTGFDLSPKLFYPNTDVAGIYDQKKNDVLVRLKIASHQIEEGIFVGSMAPHNWFHWLIDTLPTVYFSRYLPADYDSFPLLLPDRGLVKQHWIESLEIVRGSREIVPVSAELHHRVSNLVRLESITKPAPRAYRVKVPARISVYADYLVEYRDFVLSHYQLTKVTTQLGKRTLIGRKPSSVRNYNQDEITEVLRRLGFDLVFIEDLDLRDSIKVFRESEIIVGPHGAGWANMLFCSPLTKVVMWTWPDEIEENWYENIAFVSGVQFRQVHTARNESHSNTITDPRIANYKLNPELILSTIKQLVATS